MKKYGYPFSRSFYAIVANALAAAGAKVVAFDLIFDQEQPQDQLGDQMLVEVTSNYENIIHGWNASLRMPPASLAPYGPSIPSPIPDLPGESEFYNAVGSVQLPYADLLRGKKDDRKCSGSQLHPRYRRAGPALGWPAHSGVDN